MSLQVNELKGQLDWMNIPGEMGLLDENYETFNRMYFMGGTVDEYRKIACQIRENAENLLALIDNAVDTYYNPYVEREAYRCDDCNMVYPRNREQCMDCEGYNINPYCGKYKYEPKLK